MGTIADLSSKEQAVLKELQLRIKKQFSHRSLPLTLLGSRATGEAPADSDVDVPVEIHSHCISFEEKRKVRRLAGGVCLSSGLVLLLLIADRLVLAERGDYSIFLHIREEGPAL